jgi:hypothetical protein
MRARLRRIHHTRKLRVKNPVLPCLFLFAASLAMAADQPIFANQDPAPIAVDPGLTTDWSNRPDCHWRLTCGLDHFDLGNAKGTVEASPRGLCVWGEPHGEPKRHEMIIRVPTPREVATDYPAIAAGRSSRGIAYRVDEPFSKLRNRN